MPAYSECRLVVSEANPNIYGHCNCWGSSVTPTYRLRVTMDGVQLNVAGQPLGLIPLLDDRREHQVEVELG